MKITTSLEKLDKVVSDVLVIFLFSNEKLSPEISRLDKSLSGAIGETISLGDFKGKLYETTSIYSHGKVGAVRVFLSGMGKRSEFESRIGRNVAGAATRRAIKIGAKSIAIFPGDEINAEELIEGVNLAIYDPGLYKTKKEEINKIKELKILGRVDNQVILHSQIVSETTNWVRKLISEPANVMTPNNLVEEAKRLASKYKMKIEVLNEKEAEKKGLGAFAGVAKGSEEPSYFVTVKYNSGSKKTLGVVGKGITFDSGGISIKPSEKMHEMKMDMSGAAACLGFLKAVGQLRPKVNVVTILPLTENLPGGKALKPGDVLKAYNGKTIEVINTDAEGRVVLADGLSYAVKQGVTHLVDLATLTGAVVVALGDQASAVLGRPQSWLDVLKKSSYEAGERLWQLPIYPEHKELLKSDIADVANVPPVKGAGVIAGAVFLQEFVPNKIPWAHIDIAGTSWLNSDQPYMAKGPVGFGVRTLVKLIESLEKES